MFYDRPDCIRLSEWVDDWGSQSGIFVFKNIIPQHLVEKIESQLNSASKEEFRYEETLIDWYAEKVSPSPDGLHDVWEFMSELLGPEYVIHPSRNLLTLRPGDGGMFIHSDSPGKGACHRLSQPDVWQTCCVIDFGVVAYFGDWEGGEVFYPNIRPDSFPKAPGSQDYGSEEECFEYKPEKGDVVIHSAFWPYNHGVREVTSGTRYAFSNFSLQAVDNPGTFHNYGTEEYVKQIAERTPEQLTLWARPLIANPQFSSDVIKAIQDSGLKGDDIADKFFSDMEKEEVPKIMPEPIAVDGKLIRKL